MTETRTATITNKHLKIMQYNVAKKREVMDSILNDITTKDYTLLMIQEHYHYRKNPLLHQSWTLIEPTLIRGTPPRTAIYVNNKRLPPASFEQIAISNGDIIAISIQSKSSHMKPTLIMNIYNPHQQSIVTDLRHYLLQHIQLDDYETIIIAGDFNLHHPLWNPQGYTEHDPEADDLIEIMIEANLMPLLPPGTVTYPTSNASGGTAIDLVWGNLKAEENTIKCHTIADDKDHASDHLPIEILLDITPRYTEPVLPGYNYAKTNWEALKQEIRNRLPPIIDPVATTPLELDNYAMKLTTAIKEAITVTTPRKKPSPHSKRWWNDELSELRKIVNCARNEYRRTELDEDKTAWKELTSRYKGEIKAAKEKMWREFVEEADEKTIWMVKKYIDKLPTPHYIPTINNATSNSHKARELKNTFFPPPPPADLSDIDGATYQEPVSCNQNITIHQVHRAIDKTSPKKAPGPDEVTNQVLKKSFDIIQNHMHALIQASINLGHFPATFKSTTTVVLRKPAKPDYTKPNAYRPIALENTMGKIIESVVTELLSYTAEEYNLLPDQHYGGRPGRTGEEAMIVLTEKIFNAWKERDVYSVVFMDVAGAFNNVHHKRLQHNLKRRRVPEFIVNWVESFLAERSTKLRFNGIDSEKIAVNAGVPQGSPISPILYLFYNADLLDIPSIRGLSLGFIDDIAYGVQGESGRENAKELEAMLKKADKWREKHGARFETSKYVLIHFTRKRAATADTSSITVSDTTIKPANEARYLGIILDKGLRFKQHIQYAANKGMKFALALSRIAKSTWGATYRQLRTLFNTIVATRMDYAAIVWHRPTKRGQTITSDKVEAAQRTAMKAILGTFRTTTTSALEIDSFLLPTHLRLRKKVLQSYTCMQTTQEKHPIHQVIKRANNSKSKVHLTTLEYLARSYPEFVNNPLETIKPYARPPWWIPSFTICIPPNKKAAKASHDQTIHDSDTISIYTDGSGIDGHIGAAAYSPTTSQTQRLYLGSEANYNVYTAEISALELATTIAKEAPPNYTKCVIYVDSQAAIKGIIKPHKQSGQTIITAAIDCIESLQCQRPMEVTIAWIPGHKDIEGNEIVDQQAKQAAKTKGTSPDTSSTIHKPLKSSRMVTIQRFIDKEWETAWNSTRKGAKQLHRITSKMHTQTGPKLYENVGKRHDVAQLARLRTGHCSLNQYLYRFNHSDTPCCECNEKTIETVQHYLLQCPRYDRQRAKLLKKVGVGGMWIEKLLGYPKLVNHTLEYIKDTKRFNF